MQPQYSTGMLEASETLRHWLEINWLADKLCAFTSIGLVLASTDSNLSVVKRLEVNSVSSFHTLCVLIVSLYCVCDCDCVLEHAVQSKYAID